MVARPARNFCWGESTTNSLPPVSVALVRRFFLALLYAVLFLFVDICDSIGGIYVIRHTNTYEGFWGALRSGAPPSSFSNKIFKTSELFAVYV